MDISESGGCDGHILLPILALHLLPLILHIPGLRCDRLGSFTVQFGLLLSIPGFICGTRERLKTEGENHDQADRRDYGGKYSESLSDTSESF